MNGLGAADHCEGVDLTANEIFPAMFPSFIGTKDLCSVDFIGGFQAGTNVYGIADDRIILVAFPSDVADDHVAGMESHADVELWPAFFLVLGGQALGDGQMIEGGLRGALCVVHAGFRRAKNAMTPSPMYLSNVPPR